MYMSNKQNKTTMHRVCIIKYSKVAFSLTYWERSIDKSAACVYILCLPSRSSYPSYNLRHMAFNRSVISDIKIERTWNNWNRLSTWIVIETLCELLKRLTQWFCKCWETTDHYGLLVGRFQHCFNTGHDTNCLINN